MSDPWNVVVGAATLPPPVAHKPMAGTEQQEDFWLEVLTGRDHIALNALAGCGKSTSAREAMWRYLQLSPDAFLRYTCFNKAIAVEFAAKSPPTVDVGTMHSFGLKAIKRHSSVTIDKNKTYSILDALGHSGLQRFLRRAVASLVSAAKGSGVCRTDWDGIETLVDRFDIECFGKDDRVIELAMDVLERSATMLNVVDFDDMLWLPTVHGMEFPDVEILFIDEAQDLNPIQHRLLDEMCQFGRTIIIGDPFQSIYSFRGADSDSMPGLTRKLGAVEMPLTVTFRCPASHVELARQIVPTFTAAPNAPEGTIERSHPEQLDDMAVPGDLVICRSNAPLVSACLRAIGRRTPAAMRGRAIGDSLTSILRKVKADSLPTVAAVIREVEHWRAKRVDRLAANDGNEDLIEQANDRARCLEAIAESCESPAEMPKVVAALFDDANSRDRITFSSIHRAKGSEARRVHYLQIGYSERRDQRRPPKPWELVQRSNLDYVAKTRSLDYLNLLAC